MASHTGSEGFVNVGANTIAEIKGYSVEESTDTIETTTMGDTDKTYVASLGDWSGSIDVLWDETDTNGQVALTNGASATFNFYPEGSTSGDTYMTGTGIVTGRSIKATHDGLVEASITIQGSGGLTTTTVGA